MKYLLDTNACIQLLRARGSEAVRRRIEACGEDEVALCSVVRAELLHGAMRSREREHNLTQIRTLLAQFPSLPFDDAAADHAADIPTVLGAEGMLIGPHDVLIAAIALAHGITLVTHNRVEFSRVPGLTIEDWEESR